MKKRLPGILALMAVLSACAGGPRIQDEAPAWVSMTLSDTKEYRFFRGTGRGETQLQAKAAALDNLVQNVLKGMNLENLHQRGPEAAAAVRNLRNELSQALRNPDNSGMEGVKVIHRDSWVAPEGGLAFGVEIRWEREAFRKKTEFLFLKSGVSSPDFMILEGRALAAEDAGRAYDAALLWAAAAGIAENEGNIGGFRRALENIQSILKDLQIEVTALPEEAYQGSRPEKPVIFQASYEGQPVANAEFLITYPRMGREGVPVSGAARVNSGSTGRIAFRPPEIPVEGAQLITIALSASPFLTSITDISSPVVRDFISALELPVAQASFNALSPLRTIPSGILILETDLAGNPLDSADAAEGLLDHLKSDGFNIAVIDLNPGVMQSRNEKELLRDLKSDSRFSKVFDRVIHGTVVLESFEQSGNTYTVRVSGTLTLSDIQRQVPIYSTKITKSSRAPGSRQAVSAAFRQLGRSFAEELIAQAQ